MLHNHLQDMVGKVAELLAYRILCEWGLKRMLKHPKSMKVSVFLPLKKSRFGNFAAWKKLHKISLVKFVDVVQKGENKR